MAKNINKDTVKEEMLISKLDSEYSELIYKTLIGKTNTINNQNIRFLENFKKWYKEKLDKYKHKKLNQGNGWDPNYDIIMFNYQLIKVFKRVFSNITTHGSNKNGVITKKTDLDGNASIFLIKKFLKINKINLSYVDNGETKKGNLNVDTGFFQGIDIKLGENSSFFTSTLIIDHHPNGVASTTFMIYAILNVMGLIPCEEKNQVKHFVEFINILDSLPYENAEELYLNSHKNMLGIAPMLKVEYIYTYFKYYKNGIQTLDDKILNMNVIDCLGRKTTIRQLSIKREKIVQKSLIEYEQAEKDGFLVNTNFGKLLLDINLNIPNGPELINFKKVSLLKIFTTGDIYYNNPNGIDGSFEKYGVLVRGKMLFLKRNDINYEKKLKQLLIKLNISKEFKFQIKNLCGSINPKVEKIQVSNEEINIEIKKLNETNKEIIKQIENNANLTNINCNGIVTRIYNYGILVDIGGIKGLLHKSNSTIKNIKNNYKLGDIINISIIEILKQNGETKLVLG